MGIVVAGTRGLDHFEPEAALSPQEQRKLRGHLEKIDYAGYAANVKVISQTLGATDIAKFEQLAAFTARARAQWVNLALALAEKNTPLAAEHVKELSALHSAYKELSEAYEAMRRMVERGYLNFKG